MVTMHFFTLTGGPGLRYTWSLGDGTDYVNTTTPYITHAYSSSGQFNISVMATNSVDRKGNISTVTVEDPVTSIGINSSIGTAGEKSELQITVPEGTAVRYDFYFASFQFLFSPNTIPALYQSFVHLFLALFFALSSVLLLLLRMVASIGRGEGVRSRKILTFQLIGVLL